MYCDEVDTMLCVDDGGTAWSLFVLILCLDDDVGVVSSRDGEFVSFVMMWLAAVDEDDDDWECLCFLLDFF
jgi:exosome complex RNA-binding protein Rrp42 (RNase PH superfamily)